MYFYTLYCKEKSNYHPGYEDFLKQEEKKP